MVRQVWFRLVTIAKLSLPDRYLRDTADDAPETRSEAMFTELQPGFARTDPGSGRRRGLKTAIATVRHWRRDQRVEKADGLAVTAVRHRRVGTPHDVLRM